MVFGSREHYPPTMVIQERLMDADWEHVWLYGLEHVHEWLDLMAHSTQLSALIERWHTPTESFHLPIGEATVTLLDVWQILRVLIRGTYLEYVLEGADPFLRECFNRWRQRLPIQRSWLSWRGALE